MDPTRLSIVARDGHLALWIVPGLGPATLARLSPWAADRWDVLHARPGAEWASGAPVPPAVRTRLARLPPLGALAAEVRTRAEGAGMRIVHRGEDGYPALLARVGDAPPILFVAGTVGPERPRLALVGTRHPEPEAARHARGFAAALAARGVGIVSGAAAGIDRAAHQGALDVGGETWAFLGSALDAVDGGARRMVEALLAGGGAVFSELPPGVGATRSTFPRRNRLVSGASNAVLVLRAGPHSGALHTVRAAQRQGRPVLACPGDPWAETARACNALLAGGVARACVTPADALRAAGLDPGVEAAPRAAPEPGLLRRLSPAAARAYGALARGPADLAGLEAATRLDAGALVGALGELELLGLLVQHAGRRYERL